MESNEGFDILLTQGQGLSTEEVWRCTEEHWRGEPRIQSWRELTGWSLCAWKHGGTLARRAGDPELARVDRLELVCVEARRYTDERNVAGRGRQRSWQMDSNGENKD